MVYLVKYIIQKIMFKVKKVVSVLLLMVMILCFNHAMVFASTKTVTAVAEMVGRDIVISGKVNGANESNKVLLLVGSLENVLYINEANTSAKGEFSFKFRLPYDSPSGTYSYSIGNNAGSPRYNGEVYYSKTDITEERKIADADINVKLSGYVPKVTGLISCIYGKSMAVSVTNTANNTVILSDTITSETGIYNLSLELPSILSSGSYKLSMVCTGGEQEFMSLDADIICEIYKVTVNASIETDSDVRIEATAKNTNVNLINERGNITGEWSKSVTIPNIIPTAEFDVTMDAYECYLWAQDYATCSVTGISGDEFSVVAKGWNIPSFTGRRFEITYDSSQIELINAFGMLPDNSVGTGRRGNIEIEKYTPGRIVFKIHNIVVPEGNTWTGAMNVFKFRFKDGYTGEADLKIQ